MSILSILFDRDGTLIEDRHYLSDPEGVCLLLGVGKSLEQLGQLGKNFFLVSNQSGVGRGFFTHKDVDICNQRLQSLLKEFNSTLDFMVYCPHSPEDACDCRKPSIGMWKQLCSFAPLQPKRTIMVGDKVEDIQLAYNADLLASILVLTGKGESTCKSLGISIESPCMLFLEEKRYGYPQAVIKDFSYLIEAITSLETFFFATGITNSCSINTSTSNKGFI